MLSATRGGLLRFVGTWAGTFLLQTETTGQPVIALAPTQDRPSGVWDGFDTPACCNPSPVHTPPRRLLHRTKPKALVLRVLRHAALGRHHRRRRGKFALINESESSPIRRLARTTAAHPPAGPSAQAPAEPASSISVLARQHQRVAAFTVTVVRRTGTAFKFPKVLQVRAARGL